MSAVEAIVIGASAGAVDALSAILCGLPRNYPIPILMVVHIPPDKDSVLAELLSKKCQVNVREAEDKESIAGECVFIAPPDYHLLVEQNKSLSLSSDEPVLYSRPSIDVLFETAADVYGEALIGIVLTGANQDGAQGLKAVVDAGGIALVQNPLSAYSSTMPQAALDACGNARALSLPEIVSYLLKAASL